MSTFKKILAIILVCVSPLWATGPTFVTASTPIQCTSSLTCTNSFTATNVGDVVIGCVGVNGVETTITLKDNAGTPVTLTAGSIELVNPAVAIFYYTVGSGVTSYTSTLSAAHASSIIMLEYSGVSSVVGTPTGGAATGSANPLSVSPTANESGDLAVACMNVISASQVLTATSGTIRQQIHTAAPGTGVMENTATGATATALSATSSVSGAWNGAGIILRTAATGVVNPPHAKIF